MNAAMRKTDDAGDAGALQDHCDCPSADDLAESADLPGTPEPLHEEDRTLDALSGARVAASDGQLARWIEAIVNQDDRALAALYDATFTRVFGLVQRIVRNTAMAEEVVEDAYFQVWRQAVRFDPARGKAMTWLLAMARSRAIDALRREARFRHEALDDAAAPEFASKAAPVDELLDLARHRSDLHQALMLLGAEPRQLLSLAFFRGLSHEEIAEVTQLPLGTVKSQIRRALLSLRRLLGASDTPALV